MKLRFTLSALMIFLFTAYLATAQDSSFQLKDYKYRTPGFRALELVLNLNGGVNNSKFENRENFKNRSFNTNPNINYFKTFSSNNRQHTTGISLRPSYYANFSSYDTIRSKSRSSTISFSWNRMDRFYFKKDRFLETGNNFSAGGSNNLQTGNNSSRNAETRSLNDKLTLGVGKGRMENVQDAQMAMFIINDLKKMGLLQQDLSIEKYNELAKLITEINNRRVFDNRIRRIYELTKIDSFFKVNNLVNQPSIAYFTTLNDNWSLAFNPGRQAGTVFYFRISPSVLWNRNINNQNIPQNNLKSYERRFTYAYEPELGFEKQKPVNLYWQKSMGATFSFIQQWQRNKSYYQDSSNPQQPVNFYNTVYSVLSFNAFYGVGFYPNNRTMINGGFNFVSQLFVNNINGQKGNFSLKPGLFLDANYFVNYRTRLFLNVQSSYYYFKPKTLPSTSQIYQTAELNANINIGFTHVIF